jgi:Mg2+ and Co2+ transporter CorA
MKLLTLVSAVFLPGVVLAGIMGMNFQLDFFDNTGNFWVVITAMVVFAVAILGVARWRRWL